MIDFYLLETDIVLIPLYDFSPFLFKLMNYSLILGLVISLFYYHSILFILLTLLNSLSLISFQYGADSFFYLAVFSYIFINPDEKKISFKSFLGFFILISQLSIIFTFNSLAKIQDEFWVNGKVMMTIFPDITHHIALLWGNHPIFLYQILTLFIIGIQLLSLLLFVKKFRKIFCYLLISMHLVITLFLHPYFGLICIFILLNVSCFSENMLKKLAEELDLRYIQLKKT